MIRYAEVVSGEVVNVVLWDGETEYEGSDALVSCPDEVSVGWVREGGEWVAPEPDVTADPLPPPEPTIDDLRHAEYLKPGGADSLYMKWQAGEATEAEWLAERERVRLLYPDPAE